MPVARFAGASAPLALLLLAASCAKEASSSKPRSDAPPSAASTLSAEARANMQAAARVGVEPRLGGSVFLAGDSQVELAIGADGRVDGLVYDATGKPVAPDHVTEFTVTLNAEGTARPRVNLAWDASAQCFQGQTDAAAALVVKPVDVNLQIDGTARTGVLEAYALLPANARVAADAKLQARADVDADTKLAAPRVNANGKLAADAKGLADATLQAKKLKAPNGSASVQAKAGAKASVRRPKASVSAKASAGADEKKSGASASIKGKASFGFGN